VCEFPAVRGSIHISGMPTSLHVTDTITS
jgi:hypothetical protein